MGPLRFAIRFLLFVALLCCLGEVWFRTAMPAAETPTPRQDADGIYHFDPTAQRAGTYTFGRLARNVGTWRINDAGWLSPIPYVPFAGKDRPLVALFGDSYVESLMTDANDHIDIQTMRLLDGQVDCYAFGAAGWYLEQYVATARHVEARYRPDVIVIVATYGDVGESIRGLRFTAPNWFQIARSGSSYVEVPPAEIFTPTWKYRLAKQSALVRYLRFNAKLALPGITPKRVAVPSPAAPPATAALTRPDAAAVERSQAAQTAALVPPARYMVDLLCEQHPGTPILILGNDGRRRVALEELNNTPASPDLRALTIACRDQRQCHVIDLTPVFSRDWAANHKEFESPDGSHWNAYGNGVVARTIRDFVVDHDLVESSSDSR